jgi:hypothetical protein
VVEHPLGKGEVVSSILTGSTRKSRKIKGVAGDLIATKIGEGFPMNNPNKKGYLEIGFVLGWIAGILTFIAAYIYCIATYGFLFGLGLGWLPSGILAVIVGFLTMFLWGPALVVLAVFVLLILASLRR